MMHCGYILLFKMAVAHCSKLRPLSRLLGQQNSHLHNYLRNQLKNTYQNLTVLSVRPFCSSTAAKESQTDSTESPKRLFDLTFGDYQKLKRKMKSRQRVAGLPIAAVALVTSSAVSAYLNPNMFDAPPDQIEPIMGMDPLIFCGLCGVASAGVGYVVGSALFRSLWKLFNKDVATKMEMREADFLERISSKRAASFSKFEDDYYGESIKTLSDYRQWLREQEKKKKADRKFEKKDEKEQKEEERTAEAH